MRSSPGRRAVVFCALALASAALTCAKEPDTGAAATATSLTRVTININPTIPYAPLMIAKDEGFFEEEGIAVEFVSIEYNSALAALVTGKIDVLSSAVRVSAFNMIQRGTPIQVVLGKGNENPACSAGAFVAPPAMAKRIAAAGGSPRGERLAILHGGVTEYLTSRLLGRHNLTVDDVVAIPMPHGTPGSSRDGINAVKYVGEPNLSILLNEGEMGVVATADELDPGHLVTFIVYGKRLLHEDPDLGRRVMRAYVRGLRQVDAGKSDRNVEIISRYTKLPPEIIRDICWATSKDDGRIDPQDVQPFLDWALESGYLDGPVTTGWWNPAFLDDATRSLSRGAQ